MNVQLISYIGLVILILVFFLVKRLERKGYFQPHKKIGLMTVVFRVVLSVLAVLGFIAFAKNYLDRILAPI